MEKKNKETSSTVTDLESIVRSLQTTYECLSFELKRIKPCMDSLQGKTVQEEEVVIATKDLLNRLSVGGEKLKEASCLIADALSSMSIGCKNYKQTTQE